jgi:hypothetical protein
MRANANTSDGRPPLELVLAAQTTCTESACPNRTKKRNNIKQ